LGVLFNGAAVWRLRKGKDSLNQRTVMLHLLEDVLGWVAVLIGSIAIYFTGFHLLDPLLSVGIAAYILFNALKNLVRILRVFLQAVPDELDVNALKSDILKVAGVREIHDFHLWSLDGNYHVLTLHVVAESAPDIQKSVEIKEAIRQLSIHHKVEHVTIELESEAEHCLIDCR
jgi:cobalt-zinc-cadmium efflux system protein